MSHVAFLSPRGDCDCSLLRTLNGVCIIGQSTCGRSEDPPFLSSANDENVGPPFCHIKSVQISEGSRMFTNVPKKPNLLQVRCKERVRASPCYPREANVNRLSFLISRTLKTWGPGKQHLPT